MAAGFVIQNIRLQNFRNYSEFELNDLSSINILQGQNAIGKTNIIEAVQLLTQITSFRNPLISDLVNKNTDVQDARIEANFYDERTDSKANFTLSIFDGKKTYKLNDKKKSISECKGKFPSVIFTPDDLSLVKGSNTMRRNAVDVLGGQISRDYYKVLKDYSKVLKQKNKLLKEGSSTELLQSLNDVMVLSGAQLVFYRLALIKKIVPVVENFYSEISGKNEKLSVEYYPS